MVREEAIHETAVNGQEHPWPGLASYQEQDHIYFFGRGAERTKLLERIEDATLTVLHGPSGAGKTSLLQAGILPLLRHEHYLPVLIRPGTFGADGNLMEHIKQAIEVSAAHNLVKPYPIVDTQEACETLWEYLHRVEFWDHHHNLITPVLVFDQFEELFTVGADTPGNEQFLHELSDLVEKRVPESIRQRQEDRGEKIPYPHDTHRYRVVISLRNDFVDRLDQLIDLMPSIKHNRFPLRRMNGYQALEAVLGPAQAFATRHRLTTAIVSEEVADTIVRFVAAQDAEGDENRRIDREKMEVDPPLLSLFCRELNIQRLERGKDRIMASEVAMSKEGILRGFYENCFSGLSPRVRLFVEERFLSADGYRTLVPEDEAEPAGVSNQDIAALVKRRLIRYEERLGRPQLELTHDVLSATVREGRDRRRQRRRVRKLVVATGAALGTLAITIAIMVVVLSLYAGSQNALRKANELNLQLEESNKRLAETQLAVDQFLYRSSVESAASRLEGKQYTLFRESLWQAPEQFRNWEWGYLGLYTPTDFGVLRAHASIVWDVAYSPDGTRIASGSYDKTGRIWDAETGALLFVLSGHTDIVLSVVFSPDSSKLVTASEDGDARIWKADTGEELALLEGHEEKIWSASFSPDGTRVATASWDDTVRIWDATTGDELAVLHGHESDANSARFSPDGTRLVTTADDQTSRIWDTATWREIAVLTGHTGLVVGGEHTPDGSLIVTASFDNTARVWDAHSGTFIAALTGHGDVVHSMAISPDGKYLVTGSADQTARIWDLDSHEPTAILRGHEERVYSVAFSPDGARVVTASWDGTVRTWDALTGQALSILRGHDDYVLSVAFSPSGEHIVSGSSDATLHLWNSELLAGVGSSRMEGLSKVSMTNAPEIILGIDQAGAEGAASSSETLRMRTARISPSGARAVIGSADTTAVLWNARSWDHVATLRGHTNEIMNAAFSPDSDLLVTTSWDSTARLWNGVTGEHIATLAGHSGDVNAAAFSTDSTRLITAAHESKAGIWDTATGDLVVWLEGHEDSVRGGVFNPDGTRAITASYDGTVRMWDANTGELLEILRGHEDQIHCISLSPDGSQIATGAEDNTVRIWELESGRNLLTMSGHTGLVFDLDFSPDGTLLASAGWDHTARIWDATTGAVIAVLDEHTGDVNSVAFSADGSQLVTSSGDQTVRTWDTASWEQISVLQGHAGAVVSAEFDPITAQVLSASTDGTARVWSVFTGDERSQLTTQGLETASETPVYSARVLDGVTGTELARLSGHTNTIETIAASPDGSRIVTGAWDNTARIWDAATGAELHTLSGHTDWVRSAVFSPDGAHIATGSDDNTVRIWNAASGEQFFLLEGHTDWVRSVAYSPDGTRLASGADDGVIRIWDPATGEEKSILEGHTDWVMHVSFDPSGTRILSRDSSGAAWLWDTEADTKIASFETGGGEGQAKSDEKADSVRRQDGSTAVDDQEEAGNRSPGESRLGLATSISFAGFTRDGQRILTASNDKAARVWDARTGDAVLTLRGHRGVVLHASMSPDNTRIATASDDGTARIWNAETGEEMLSIEHDSPVQLASFSKDGMRLVTSDNSGNAFIWHAAPYRLEDLPGDSSESWEERFTLWQRSQYEAWIQSRQAAAR